MHSLLGFPGATRFSSSGLTDPAMPLGRALMFLDAEFLAVLLCPVCRSGLRQERPEALRCSHCRREFPVADGIPNLLPESGRIPETAGSGPGQTTSDLQ